MNSDGLPTGSFFESLEPRLLLSGTISTALVGGNLTILGDAASNQIAIVRDGNTITITGNDGETFAGAGAVINNVLGNIRIVMGGGDDQVTIGEAANKFWVGCEIPRDLIIDLGGGDDVLTLIAVQARNCTVIGGAGLNQISIIDNAGSDWIEDASQFFGNLTVTNGNDGGDILIAGTIVARNATISLGNGGGTLLVTHSVRQDAGNPAPLFGSWFMGNLTIKGGAGNDVVGLIGIPGADNLRPLDIEGHLSVSLLGSQAGGENGFWLSNVTVQIGRAHV